MGKTNYTASPSNVAFEKFDKVSENSEVSQNSDVKVGTTRKRIGAIVAAIVVVGIIAAIGFGLGLNNLAGRSEMDFPLYTPTPDPDGDSSIVDGQWTFWNKWSQCTKSCDTGNQQRTRTCDSPPPINGGMDCVGITTQQRTCSKWSCPDCSRVCPDGGTLSNDCDICLCSNNIVHGKITDMQIPIQNVAVYLKSRLWQPIAYTNMWGKFLIRNICLTNEKIVLKREKYGPVEVIASKENGTHWVVNATMNRYARPLFHVHPENKIRLGGQDVTMCCSAEGSPKPTEYIWMKNGQDIQNKGSSGTLTIHSLTPNDAGIYVCRVETSAGVSKSREALLTVKDGSTDSCSGSLMTRYEHIPNGCQAYENGILVQDINIGDCGQRPCVNSGLPKDSSCKDSWGFHCCEAKDIEKVEVNCGDFEYFIYKIVSCHCISCEETTILTGKAYGVMNGTRKPFIGGNIVLNGKTIATTTSSGFFSFEIQSDESRITLSFQDDFEDAFMDTIKVIEVRKGTTTTANVVLPLKPKLIKLLAQHGLDIPLGEENNETAVATLSIPENALSRENGEQFNGTANLRVHFVDPRSFESLDTMYGELACVDEGGSSVDLETFGMFQINIKDEDGEDLFLTSPVKLNLDPDIFNISSDKDGNPDVGFFFQDKNTGHWIEAAKPKYETHSNTVGRKLLSKTITIEVDTTKIPTIEHKVLETTTISRVQYKMVASPAGNIDRKVTLYRKDTRQILVTAADACFARVQVYKDLKRLSEPQKGIRVRAYTQELHDPKFKGKHSDITKADGGACLRIFCKSVIHLTVDSGTKTIYAADDHDVPARFQTENYKNEKWIKFISEEPDKTKTKHDPVWLYDEKSKCEVNGAKGAHFKFAPFLSVSERVTRININVHDNKFSWYPNSRESATRSTCFIKVEIDIDIYDVNIYTFSNQKEPSKANNYGYTIETPNWEDDSDKSKRGVCMEFRCPGLVIDGSTVSAAVPTHVDTRITSGSGLNCSVVRKKEDLEISQHENGFSFTAQPGLNYGPRYGIFKGVHDENIIRNFCNSGHDTGNIDNIMKPSINPAVSFQCKIKP